MTSNTTVCQLPPVFTSPESGSTLTPSEILTVKTPQMGPEQAAVYPPPCATAIRSHAGSGL